MTIQTTYQKKLLDPRWQKKRLEILQRDGFTCQKCYDDTNTLHVHHRRYLTGKEPWDYEDRLLITLCKDCHENESFYLDSKSDFYEILLDKGFMPSDIFFMMQAMFSAKFILGEEIMADIFAFAFSDLETQQIILDRLTKSKKEKK